MHRKYMQRAIELAQKGAGWTAPNPLVGAVIVKDGRIIGEGFHEKYGQLHAERNAIASLAESAEGAVLYVTLEPCCHYGKTPPCTEAILEEKISKVYIGSRDPNPLVAGKGVKFLRVELILERTGIPTVLADDPMLNCRLYGAHQPLRVIVDSHLRIPTDSKILQTAREYPTLIVCAEENEAAEKIRACQAEVIALPDERGKVSMKRLMEYLGSRQIDSVLVEGGGELHEACRQAGIVRHVCCYVAPKILGGKEARTPVEGSGAATLTEALELSEPKITRLGEDVLLECDVKEAH